MMKELMVLHRCQVYVELMPGTTRFGPAMRVIVTAVSNEPGSDLKPCEEAMAVEYPNIHSKNMEGTVYNALHQLDNRLTGKWWKQEDFILP